MKPVSELDLPKLLTHERHRIHLIGVAGSGMSGIAALLLELGHNVSGSDKVSSLETDRLQRLGLRFREQHRAEDAADAELIVFSSAIKIDNPILMSARDSGKPVARRRAASIALHRRRDSDSWDKRALGSAWRIFCSGRGRKRRDPALLSSRALP